MGDSQEIETRDQLIWALQRASEMEHLLMCLYLSAAFSVKKAQEEGIGAAQAEQARRWEANILKIARQEMEHLALVNNLLIGMGAAPYFSRPNFPLKHYLLDRNDLAFLLEPFNLFSIGRFVLFEAPDDWGKDGPDYGISKEIVEECVSKDPCAPRDDGTQQFTIWAPDSPPVEFQSVQDLYDAIDRAIKNEQRRPDLDNLFTGSAGKEPFKDFQFNFQFNIFTFPVTDIRSANAALALILEQGEGIKSQPGYSSHFGLFSGIFNALRADDGTARFDPAWNVVCNPSRDNVTNQFATELMALFNEVNTTMLYMLSSFYTYFSPTSADISPNRISTALQSTAFAPMMTMLIRPLGEVLCRLPAGTEGHYAGPNWEISESDYQLEPSSKPEFFTDRLESISKQLKDLTDAAPTNEVRNRLGFMYESAWRMNQNFQQMTSG
jgi:hypothetical protein